MELDSYHKDEFEILSLSDIDDMKFLAKEYHNSIVLNIYNFFKYEWTEKFKDSLFNANYEFTFHTGDNNPIFMKCSDCGVILTDEDEFEKNDYGEIICSDCYYDELQYEEDDSNWDDDEDNK